MVTPQPPDDGSGIIYGRYLTVKAAAEHYSYNKQYLRRLLRAGRLEGAKIGQVWLVKLASLEAHLRSRRMEQDRRFGPQRTL